MGYNSINLTDRDYMQNLQRKILDDYEISTSKRIKNREANEMERVKKLVLSGKVPFSNVPPEMNNHPVMVIERYCQKIMAEKSKNKKRKVDGTKLNSWEKITDCSSRLSDAKEEKFTGFGDNISILEDEDYGFNITSTENFENMRYENLEIQKLRDCQNIDSLYKLSDAVIGSFKKMESLLQTELSQLTQKDKY